MPDGIKIRPSSASDAVEFLADNVTYGGDTGRAQIIKLVVGEPDAVEAVSSAHPLPTSEGGTYGYTAGTATGTVDVPTGALLKRVSVLAGVSALATVTIGGGTVITIPAGGSFDEDVPGRAVGADVVIGGAIQSFYVSWVI